MRQFYLERKEDVSGVSGIGKVAVGVQFPSGKIVLEWCVEGIEPTIAVYDNIGVVERVHGHNGKTLVCWQEE